MICSFVSSSSLENWVFLLFCSSSSLESRVFSLESRVFSVCMASSCFTVWSWVVLVFLRSLKTVSSFFVCTVSSCFIFWSWTALVFLRSLKTFANSSVSFDKISFLKFIFISLSFDKISFLKSTNSLCKALIPAQSVP